jgi:hypothetical protein
MPTFRTTLKLSGKTSGIPVPEEVVESLGAGKRVPVVVTVGRHTYRNTVAPYRGEYMISLSSENRELAGLVGDEELDVTIEVDSAPREVTLPDDLASALAVDDTAREAFEKLSYSARNAHVLSVTGAKAVDTRRRRIEKVVDTLHGGG